MMGDFMVIRLSAGGASADFSSVAGLAAGAGAAAGAEGAGERRL